MKIMVAHHFYASTAPSGENAAVRRDVEMLRDRGHDVRELFRHTDKISTGQLVHARQPAHEFRRMIADAWRPDILHIHNLFPLLTMSVVRVAVGLGIPVVQTVHNYRRTCAAGTHFRDGRICNDCSRYSLPWPALAHRCYRGSSLQTLPVVANQVLDAHLLRNLDAHIALTEFMRSKLVDSHVPPEAVLVRPTSVPDPGPNRGGGSGLLFVGRLTEDKGAMLLLNAWNRSASSQRRHLSIIGDGPQSDEVIAAASKSPSVTFLGRQSASAVQDAIRRSAAVIVPSLWYEGFPTVIVEAFAHSRPVIACTNANARTIVGQGGWLAEPNPRDLAATIDDALSAKTVLDQVGLRARTRYEAEMTPDSSYRILMSAYQTATERHTRRHQST
jgi:glycosyltransferase involved in cell wall biosynthesis